MNPVRWRLRAAAAAIGAVCVAHSASALELTQSAPELTQTAAELEKGQVFMTKGLVCDRASEIDAVITLAKSGEALQGALEQINAGAQTPRCIVGRVLFAQYVDKARTFSVKDQTFHVHHVQVVGVAMKTPTGVVPMRLEKPMQQYVVSTEDSVPA